MTKKAPKTPGHTEQVNKDETFHSAARRRLLPTTIRPFSLQREAEQSLAAAEKRLAAAK